MAIVAFCLGVSAIVGVPGLQPARAEAASSSWYFIRSPDSGGGQNLLDGITCITTTDCFAVGIFHRTHKSGGQGLVESWNGKAWSVVTSPSPDSGPDGLGRLSCTGPTFCVAVGYAQKQTLIETWNGTNWSITPSPNATSSDVLGGVSCTSPTFCVAVGDEETGSGELTMVESWDGTTWSVVPSPNPLPIDTGLSDVSCTSPTSCVAVGFTGGYNTTQTLVESWDGMTWSVVPSPNPSTGDDFLSSVSCYSSGCTAVGLNSTPQTGQALVESWDGTAWSIVSGPSGGIGLYGVSCTSSTSCVTVGSGGTVASWDGATWSLVSSPTPGRAYNFLNGVSCTATSCMAVGEQANRGTHYHTLAVSSAPPSPSIGALQPRSAPVGTEVTIRGVRLSGATGVTFNGTAAVIATDTADEITTTVPAGATTGFVQVTTAGGTATSPKPFDVT
jgi:hypothetical protein